ncbi:MAG: glycosyltransferase family 2 protein [Ignavibacteriaceae bacterium]|jgi:glycosyltransferase involved in cell wall biosynthesis
MEKISVIIITKDEESQIEDCLKSVSWADEIIVVDSESADRTVDISKKYTNKVYIRKWQGYAPQKSYALSLAGNDWVLSLDADERITDELKNEIMQNDFSRFDGYRIPRENYFLHKHITSCGWGTDSQLRLFKSDKTTMTDRLVHEGFEVSGNIGQLKHPMTHFTYNSMEKAITKINHYSSLQAIEMCEKKGKITGIKIMAHGIAAFYKSFFALKGYKDGVHGFCIAFIDSLTNFLTYIKIWEIQNKA